MIKRIMATAAVAAIPAFVGLAFMATPAAATSPVAPVTPGAYCAADAHLSVRPGPSDRIYQCQDHDGWRWVPTEPCPSASDRRLIAICYPIVYPSASASVRPPCITASPTLERLRTLPPICPSRSPSKAPSASPSSSVTASASASGGVVVIPDNGVGDKLPVTGSRAKAAALAGGVTVVVGVILAWFARRRRVQFETKD